MYRFSIISDILPEQVSSSKTGIKNVPPPIPERNQENKVRLTKKNQKLKYTKFSTTCPTFLPFLKSVTPTRKHSYYFSNWDFNGRI